MTSVQVNIFGQIYNIKGMEDDSYIRELAAFLDAKMREVQQGTNTADPHRVAILTALTICDELFRLRDQHQSLENTTETTLENLLRITEDADNASG